MVVLYGAYRPAPPVLTQLHLSPAKATLRNCAVNEDGGGGWQSMYSLHRIDSRWEKLGSTNLSHHCLLRWTPLPRPKSWCRSGLRLRRLNLPLLRIPLGRNRRLLQPIRPLPLRTPHSVGTVVSYETVPVDYSMSAEFSVRPL